MVDVGVLRNVELFESLDGRELAKLVPLFKAHHFVADDILCQEGEQGDCLFILAEGEVSASRRLGEDEDLLLAEFGPGAFFGEIALIDEKPRSASVRALSDGVLYSMRRDVFATLLASDPQTAAKMLLALSRVFCNRLRKTGEQLRTYSLINKAIVEDENFREMYIASHASA
jgi:CRP-like cAMP-binding protein